MYCFELPFLYVNSCLWVHIAIGLSNICNRSSFSSTQTVNNFVDSVEENTKDDDESTNNKIDAKHSMLMFIMGQLIYLQSIFLNYNIHSQFIYNNA